MLDSSQVPHFDWLPTLLVPMKPVRHELRNGLAHCFFEGLALECIHERVHDAIEKETHVDEPHEKFAHEGIFFVQKLFFIHSQNMCLHLSIYKNDKLVTSQQFNQPANKFFMYDILQCKVLYFKLK